MDSYLSGFSRGYTGNIGTGHAGSMSGAGSVSAAGGQNVDVTQLKTGDTFQGEITSVNGEDVQIQLANGQYLAAKLARDVQVALGQVMNLQVQSNKDNRVVLKPVYDGNSQMLRVGEAALRAANMAVNEKNLQLVAKLIENGMSIDKNTLMTYNRLALQNSNIDLSNIIKLNKLQLPVTQENARQLENYQNLEHKILDGVKSAADELVKTFESLLGEGTPLSNVPAGALQNGAKFMEQALTLLGGENEPESAAVKTQPGEAGTTAGAVNGEASEQAGTISSEKTADMGNVAMQQEGVKIIRGDMPKDAQGIPSDKIQEQLQQEGQTQTTSADSAQKNAEGESFKELLNLIKGEKSENVPDKIIQYMSSGKAQFKDIRQFLLDTEFGKSLTPEQKAKIFHSDPFKSLLKDGLQKQWTLTPEELFKDGKVEEFYQKLLRESSQLTKLMNEAMQSGAQSANAPQAKAMGNIAENVEFINQMNQMLNYVQLPLKLGNSQAHGDLYVYTNKKHMARGDGMLTAFLHLDMDYLGSLDVSIALQTQKGQITTKFYLDEDSIALVEEHIGELSARLEKKGYRCKNMILEKDEDKTVLEHVEEQVAAGSAVIGYQTFDTRA
ncbi:hypothetical protein C809_02546 [Lachnospiraceae bacterium MD335]|nr:hypothetical protein C809_02546 [Lachnospiraceae bacterium MD335]